MAPPKKLTFNFSSEATPNNYIRGPVAGRKRKQEKVVENSAVVVDDDDSPLFEPLASESPEQTEVSRRFHLQVLAFALIIVSSDREHLTLWTPTKHRCRGKSQT